MNKLVKNELKKIFSKKSTYITLIIFIGLITLVNVLVGFVGNTSFEDYTFSEENIKYLTSEIQELDPNKEDEVDLYISLKSDLDYIEFVKKYDENSWQRAIATEESYEIIRNIVTSRTIRKDDEAVATYEAELDLLKNKLDADDWQSFFQDKKSVTEATIADIQNSLAKETDKKTIEELNKNLKRNEIDLYTINYRLDNEVKYDNSYLDQALKNYQSYSYNLLEFNQDNLSNEEKSQYEEAKKDIAENKYVLDNKKDMLSYDNARNVLTTVFSDNLIFFVIFAVMIAGSIVAEEFSKGTIKMLLIRPYTRTKILLSKYISCLIMLLIGTLVIIGTQFIVGGIAFGFDSYSISPIIYNFTTSSIKEVSMLNVLATQFIAYLPMFLLLITLAFTISVVFTSTALSVTLTLLTVFFSSTVNMLITQYKIKALNIFPTMCWDLSGFLYGAQPAYEYTSLGLCITMSLIYLIIMLFISFFVFKHKNVKNI